MRTQRKPTEPSGRFRELYGNEIKQLCDLAQKRGATEPERLYHAVLAAYAFGFKKGIARRSPRRA